MNIENEDNPGDDSPDVQTEHQSVQSVNALNESISGTIAAAVLFCSDPVIYSDPESVFKQVASLLAYLKGWEAKRVFVNVGTNTLAVLVTDGTRDLFISDLGVSTNLSPYLESSGQVNHYFIEIPNYEGSTI